MPSPARLPPPAGGEVFPLLFLPPPPFSSDARRRTFAGSGWRRPRGTKRKGSGFLWPDSPGMLLSSPFGALPAAPGGPLADPQPRGSNTRGRQPPQPRVLPDRSQNSPVLYQKKPQTPQFLMQLEVQTPRSHRDTEACVCGGGGNKAPLINQAAKPEPPPAPPSKALASRPPPQ